jgi:hypothetical protein
MVIRGRSLVLHQGQVRDDHADYRRDEYPDVHAAQGAAEVPGPLPLTCWGRPGGRVVIVRRRRIASRGVQRLTELGPVTLDASRASR